MKNFALKVPQKGFSKWMDNNPHNDKAVKPPVLNTTSTESLFPENLSNQLKKDEKLAGKIGRDMNEFFLKKYESPAQDFRMTVDQKLKLFHMFFDDGAKRLYRENAARRNIEALGDTCKAGRDSYSTVARQNRVG